MKLFSSLLFLLALAASSWAVTIEQPRGFQLHPQVSEGEDNHRHPWILDIGPARIAPGSPALASASKLVLEADAPTAQLTFRNLHRSDTWIFASVSLAVAPTEANVEFLDFCGALLSFRQTEDGGRLGLLSIDADSDEWTWYELDRDLGTPVEGNDGMRRFELKFAINRKDRSWSLGVDDLAVPSLDLIGDPANPFGEDALYLFGDKEAPVYIFDADVTEVEGTLLEHSRDRSLLDRFMPEDTSFFLRENLIEIERHEDVQSVARKRVLHFRAFDVAILDQDKKAMKSVDGGPELGPLIIYSGGGPTPSYCRVTIDAEYTDIKDLCFIKWEIYQADFKGKNKTMLAEGHLKDSLTLTAPIRKGSEDPPVHISARAYLDVAKLKNQTVE